MSLYKPEPVAGYFVLFFCFYPVLSPCSSLSTQTPVENTSGKFEVLSPLLSLLSYPSALLYLRNYS